MVRRSSVGGGGGRPLERPVHAWEKDNREVHAREKDEREVHA